LHKKTLPYEKLFSTASCCSISATFLITYHIQPSPWTANLSTAFGDGGEALDNRKAFADRDLCGQYFFQKVEDWRLQVSIVDKQP